MQLPPHLQAEWKNKNQVKVKFGEIGKTKADKPKLFVGAEDLGNQLVALVVFRTTGGFRGGADHTGDRTPGDNNDFLPFPGEILVEGKIAEGMAGRMGGNSQIIALMPKGIVFCTRYSGRLYGGPSAHYYIFDGQKILSATWDERTATDLF